MINPYSYPTKQENSPRRTTSKSTEDFRTLVIYSTLGLGTATGVFLLGRHFYKKAVAKSTENRSLIEGNPATFAKQLNMAFDNDSYFSWGTNEEQIFQVFREIPSKKAYTEVQQAYANMYNRNLNADLENELSSDEYNYIIRILNAKPAK